MKGMDMKKIASLAIASLALAGCTSTAGKTATTTVTATVVPPTVTVTAQAGGASSSPASAETTKPAAISKYGPNGAYAVGRAQGGLDNVIPPGNYRATGRLGTIYHCDSVICQQAMQGAKSRDSVNGDVPVIVEIPPSDVAIYLWDVTLEGPVS